MIVVEAVGQTFRPPVRLFDWKHARKPIVALDGVSFTVERGEIVGLAGENGAGKSTLLRLVSGVLLPSRGRVEIAGCETRTQWMRAVGTMLAGDVQGSSPLSPREQLAFFAALHGKSRAAALARADQLLDEVGLTTQGRRPEGELSTGQRRRCAWARARIADPRVLVLDEPTRGLDRASCAELRGWLQKSAADGTTILLASHSDEDLALCSRVLQLSAGRLPA